MFFLAESDCRHVAPNDNGFTARMRFHQSWYRCHVLNLPPGPNPAARGTKYGNMLRPEDGRAGYNFLQDEIHRFVETRLSARVGALEPNRLRNNLLSSQPMCFNLFAPLALNTKLATQLAATLPGLPPEIQITAVRMEFAPPKDAHLNDGTAFDAFLEYTRPPSIRGFVGIETKLTEPFSQAAYDAQRPGYARWLGHSERWWNPGAEAHFTDVRYNQLWRNHMLAFSMLHQPAPAYDEGYCAVLYHNRDTACRAAIDSYRAYIQPHAQATLLEWPLDRIITAWEEHLRDNRQERDWITAFGLRYLDLDASQPAWEVFQART